MNLHTACTSDAETIVQTLQYLFKIQRDMYWITTFGRIWIWNKTAQI
jgi:hypothetical protein